MSDGLGAVEFDAFFARTADRLARHIYLATGDRERARECAQEAYLRAWRRWPALSESGEDPVAWVRIVAWRLAVDDWRRTRRLVRRLRLVGEPAEVPGPSVEALSVRQALAILPQTQRTTLVMHYFQDLSVRQIADTLDVPENTVKTRLARGRAALRTTLDSEEVPWTPVSPN